MNGQHLDVRPFQIFAPVPPMLGEAIGYTGMVFGVSLDARWVGFYWERSGDEAMYDDGRSSGTGEYTGYQAFVDHPKVAVYLRHCDFGSSETQPRHMLVLDRTVQRLYALPMRLAQEVLHRQWLGQASQAGPMSQGVSVGDLAAALDLNSWKEVTFSDDTNARVMATMQRQGQIVGDLIAWLDGQHKPVTAERIAEFEPHTPAVLLRYVVGTGAGACAQAGEMVHIHEVIEEGDQVMVTYYRDNDIDGPDASHLFSLSGSWASVMENLEVLLEPGALDDLLEKKAELSPVFGRYAAWNGQAFPIVPMLDTLAIRVSLPCARCGRNSTTVFARSGLHQGAFCYVYDAFGNYVANLRDQEYLCPRCEKARSDEGTTGVEDAQEDA